VSLNWTVVTGKAFGLVTVIVPIEVPLRATIDGLKLLLIVIVCDCAQSRPTGSRGRRAARTTIGFKEWRDRAELHPSALADLAGGCCTVAMSRGSYTRSLGAGV
jgi:hypothetical protein